MLLCPVFGKGSDGTSDMNSTCMIMFPHVCLKSEGNFISICQVLTVFPHVMFIHTFKSSSSDMHFFTKESLTGRVLWYNLYPNFMFSNSIS